MKSIKSTYTCLPLSPNSPQFLRKSKIFILSQIHMWTDTPLPLDLLPSFSVLTILVFSRSHHRTGTYSENVGSPNRPSFMVLVRTYHPAFIFLLKIEIFFLFFTKSSIILCSKKTFIFFSPCCGWGLFFCRWIRSSLQIFLAFCPFSSHFLP